MKTRTKLVTLLLTLALSLPAAAQPGSADFSRYVALGDSLTMGVVNLSVVETHQQWSFPQIISRHAGFGDIEQPLISEPGIPPELQLMSLQPLVIAPKSSEIGEPINLMLPRPYDNLGIFAARAEDLITRTGAAEDPDNPFFRIVLRGFGTPVEQAIALNPTFITLWIGNMDVLTAVRTGVTDTLTPVETFSQSYQTIVGALRAHAPNAGMVIGTIPSVTAVPFATTIPPVLVDPTTSEVVIGPDGNPIFFIAELGDGTVGQLTPGSLVTLSAQPFLSTGFGLPPQLAPLFPQLPNVGKPLPNAVVIDAAEIQQIETRRLELNQVIRQTASAAGVPIVEADVIFERFIEGVNFGGITIDASFLVGGLISLDGFHPSDLGYTIIANEFIRVINEAYGSQIPFASLVPFFENNAPAEASLLTGEVSVAAMLESPWDFGPGAHIGTAVQEEAADPDEDESPEEEETPRTRRRGTGRN